MHTSSHNRLNLTVLTNNNNIL